MQCTAVVQHHCVVNQVKKNADLLYNFLIFKKIETPFLILIWTKKKDKKLLPCFPIYI